MIRPRSRARKSDRFLKAVEPFAQVLIVTHDNPDPDAISAGWGLLTLIEERLGKRARLVGGGEIVRAENRHMVELLRAPIELVSPMPCPRNAAVVLVDAQMSNQNYLFCKRTDSVVAVIDHHEVHEPARPLAFADIRPRIAASASIVACYLREQRIVPTPELATAMLFALRTETRGSETRYTRTDRTVLLWLTEHADPSLLAQIENAPLPRQYFVDMILALQSTFVYGNAAICLLPRAGGPEIVGEVADLLIRDERLDRVLCGAVIGGDLLLSVRTDRDEYDASELVRAVVDGLGHAGGHRRRAGGKVPGTGRRPRVTESLQDEIRDRWLDVCHVNRQRGSRLVPKREIVENL